MDTDAKLSIPREVLRQRLLQQRADIDRRTRLRLDAALAQRLADEPLLAACATLAIYWPIRGEPDLSALAARWRAEGRRVALPVVGGPNRGLLFCAWDAGAPLVTGPLGIAIPRDKTPLAPDALVIPCVGFRGWQDRLWRLGYGAGFYDRTLAHRPVLAIGIGYDSAETPEFEPHADDAPLAAVVTPSRRIVSIASP